LKDEAVALVDALAPPDFILNSPIGHSNGKVRKFDNFIVQERRPAILTLTFYDLLHCCHLFGAKFKMLEK